MKKLWGEKYFEILQFIFHSYFCTGNNWNLIDWYNVCNW